MKKIQTLKGFRDFLPEEAIKRQWLKDRLIEIFESWGYDPMETPTLEPLELFKGQIGEDENLFFNFIDQGGREVALRYDQTVPTCRVVGNNFQELPNPFKRYQIQPAFRAEKPQKGRYREFVQCDADIFGVASPLADAEVIALSLDIYRKLGFKEAKVLINDRQLLKDLPYEAIVAIDKIKKIGAEGVLEDMVRKGIDLDKGKEYLKIVENLKPNETISVILDYLKNQGFDQSWYEFDPSIARSFSYSSGPIWEVVIPGSSGSVLGGERFDYLTKKLTGADIPATGFAVGFDRTLEIADELGLIPQIKTNTKVLVTIFDQKYLKKSQEVAEEFRQANINTEIYSDMESKLGKQFKYANKRGIPFVIIIGETELAENKVTLKNMETGDQETGEIDAMAKKITQQSK
jgi:histidyl-tRNA synthetase